MKSPKTYSSGITYSPLHLCETVEEAKNFLTLGYKADEVFEKITSPIHSVESYNIFKMYLEAGCNPNAGAEFGRATPLHTQTSIENLRLLIVYGANPNLRGSWGQTPLFGCDTLEKVKVLLSNGVEPDIVDNDGNLPDEWWTNEGEGIQMKEEIKLFRLNKN